MRKANVLLYGEGGSGKSGSIATIFKLLAKNPNLKVRYLMTEANAMAGMEDGLQRLKVKLGKGQLHYMVCRPKYNPKYATKQIVQDFKENYLDLSDSGASAVKIGAGDRSRHNEFISILEGLAVFKGTDYVTGEVENLGDYLQWDEDTVLVVDSLTAIVDYLVSTVKGSRSATTMKDYNDVQSNLMAKIIVPLTEQCSCSVIMLGHPTIGDDQTVKQPKEEELKVTKLYPKTFGQALNNTLISKFSEVIYAYVTRQDKFVWAGKKEGVATSPRKVPRLDNLEPDFSKYPIFGISAE
jgi:hypothetical protein